MSWCDKLAATPGIGVKLDRMFTPVSALLEPLTPLISRWVDAKTDKPAFSIDTAPDLFGCSLTTLDGYQYTVSPDTLAVEFKYRMRVKPQSAGPPIAEMLSKPLPYTELLPEITARVLELLRLTTTGKPRKLFRIGVITTTLVSMDEAPPGIMRFLKHVSKPWGKSPEFFNIEVTSKLEKRKGTADFDRCIHVLQRQEGSENDLLTIRLDWQRYFGTDRNLSMTSLPELLESAKQDALAYFEDVAQGERFDD